MAENLLGQLTIWVLVAEVVCLPLTMWLSVYMQTAQARFYNFVGGFDYHQYMNVNTPEEAEQPAPVMVQERSAQEEEKEPTLPVPPSFRDQYYTSVMPRDNSEEEQEEILEAIEEEEALEEEN